MRWLLAGILAGAALAQNAPRPYGGAGVSPPYHDLLREMSLREMMTPPVKNALPSNPYLSVKGKDLNGDRKKESIQYRWQKDTVSVQELESGSDAPVGTLEVLITDGRTKQEWLFSVPGVYDTKISTLSPGTSPSDRYPFLVLRINEITGKGPRVEAISYDGKGYVKHRARFVE